MSLDEPRVSRQNEDGSWSPAEPIRMPWWIRLEQWWHSRKK